MDLVLPPQYRPVAPYRMPNADAQELVRERGPEYIRQAKQASKASKANKQSKQSKQAKQASKASKQC